MELKKLATKIEKLINEKMAEFSSYGKEAAELSKKIAQIQEEQVVFHKKMAEVLRELEPVESLVRAQNPNMNDLFDKLKTAYLQDTPTEEVKSEIV